MGSARTILAAGAVLGLVVTDAGAEAATTATAWRNGSLVTDTAGVARRSNLVLKRANTSASEFVPLGNGVDADLIIRLKAAIPKIRRLPRTDFTTKSQVLSPSSNAAATNMLAISAQPTATNHNQENDELEPVWPYNLIGDSGSQSDLAKRTFTHRGHHAEDPQRPIHRPSQMRSATTRSQIAPPRRSRRRLSVIPTGEL